MNAFEVIAFAELVLATGTKKRPRELAAAYLDLLIENARQRVELNAARGKLRDIQLRRKSYARQKQRERIRKIAPTLPKKRDLRVAKVCAKKRAISEALAEVREVNRSRRGAA